MLTALVLICSLSVTPDLQACDRNNAVHVMRVPEEFSSPVTCLMQGQAYLAGTAIGQELGAQERVKVECSQVRTAAYPVARSLP
jgi:hypothetical protein